MRTKLHKPFNEIDNFVAAAAAAAAMVVIFFLNFVLLQ